MRYAILAAVLALLAAAYTWLWFDSAARIERELENWAEEQRARGWTVEYDGLKVDGYPYRLHARLANPRLAQKTDTLAWSWQGEALHAHAMPYNITHVIIAAEGVQNAVISVQTDAGTVTERLSGIAETARASVVWSKGLFDRLAIDIQNLEGTRASSAEPLDGGLVRTHDETLRVERFQIHSARSWPETESDAAAQGGAHRFAVRADRIQWTNHLIPGLGETIARAELLTILTRLPERLVRKRGFLDDETLTAWQADDGEVQIESMMLDWAPLRLSGTGTLKLDRRGRPKGRIALRTEDPMGAVAAFSQGARLDDDMTAVLRGAVQILTALGGEDDGSMTLPVKLKDGRVHLSSVEVAKVPSLYSAR